MERRALKQYQEYKKDVYNICELNCMSPIFITFITFREFKERIKDHKAMISIIAETINSIKERQLIEEYYYS
jgi:hypothetical protein